MQIRLNQASTTYTVALLLTHEEVEAMLVEMQTLIRDRPVNLPQLGNFIDELVAITIDRNYV